MIMASPMITPEAQLHNLDKAKRKVNIRPESMGSVVDHVVQHHQALQMIAASKLEEPLQINPPEITERRGKRSLVGVSFFGNYR